MEKQNLSSHKRYYFPHHFVFYPILLVLMATCIYCIYNYRSNAKEWVAIFIVLLLIGWLFFMMRQHYALTLQNSTVRLEMRLRYYHLTQRRLEFIEYQLSFNQLAALRFASDDQLPNLLTAAIDEKLSSTEIKKRIKDWQANNMKDSYSNR